MCCDLELNLVKCDFARVCMFSPVSPKYAPGHNLHGILYPTLFFLQDIFWGDFCWEGRFYLGTCSHRKGLLSLKRSEINTVLHLLNLDEWCIALA